MTKLEVLQSAGRRVGFYIATSSPGDGVTRYRFFKGCKPRQFCEDGGIFTVLGIKDATLYAAGLADGLAYLLECCEYCGEELQEAEIKINRYCEKCLKGGGF